MNPFLFTQFLIADEGQYLAKELFYKLKQRLLKQEGTACGYDVQQVRLKCRKCQGTGIKRLGEKAKQVECPACNGSSYYKYEDRYFLRYGLNGLIFHLATNKAPKGQPVKIIRGDINSMGVEPKLAYRALLILFQHYDYGLLQILVKNYMPAFELWEKEKIKIIHQLRIAA